MEGYKAEKVLFASKSICVLFYLILKGRKRAVISKDIGRIAPFLQESSFVGNPTSHI